MFRSKIDHSKYLHTNFEFFFEQEGFPFSRVNFIDPSESDTEEQILVILHGKRPFLLVLTTKRILHFKLPMRQSLLRRVADEGVGEVVGLIPGVGEVMDGIDNFKELRKGATGIGGWISGSKRKERKLRESLGLPEKKDYKDLKYSLKKPEELALISGYSDHIILANGFEWKCQNELLIDHEQTPVHVTTTDKEWTFKQVKKSVSFNLALYDDQTKNATSKAFDCYRDFSNKMRLNVQFLS
ncbi:hypothetical protein [Leeuwenhoekiella nanhaiensis]|uniref:Uncharacterized protein n=1 Tax=Leeuwenhoekiella nanhaiensis TaxID=1655491 RepID=A0A2G1VP53_9FLAO|nr:hypothetical protein [Leeuwenhoekiella nanhaiensis]PHQ28524.1 hypothetical protein CJ305_14625 [Leeuwenhoekiella nanhaiensis]